jgi:cytochrome c553
MEMLERRWHRPGVSVAISVPLMSLTAAAQVPTAAVLAAPCAACHGPGGVSRGAIPSINGLEASVIATRMRSFRTSGSETTVMGRIARGYTDDEIDLLAGYIAATGRK